MTTTTDRMAMMNDPTGGGWAWQPQPESRRLVEELLIAFIERCPAAARFGERLVAETGTHITDWVGVILTIDTPETRARLAAAGYSPRSTDFVDDDIHYAFSNPSATTPDILLTESDRMSVGLRVDSVADFFAANQLSGVDQIQGEPLARARWAQVIEGERAAMWVFERHGYDGFHLKFEISEHRIAAMHHFERLRARTRGGDQARVYAELSRTVMAAADELGSEWAADLFMQSEREYFLRNHCSAKQHVNRQAAMGLGLANIDHVVYATSAAGLSGTHDVFATLGFEQREHFSVGAKDEAHVLEQPITGDVVVVVAPLGDEPGYSGSWARLVGESLLASGPAGIALRGEHDTLNALLGLNGECDGAMAPIPVSADRVEKATKDGLIDESLAAMLGGGGHIGPILSLVSRGDGGRALSAQTIAWRNLTGA